MKHDPQLRRIAYGDVIQLIAESKGIALSEASDMLKKMSFGEYRQVVENIVPPSGKTIGPTNKTIEPTSVSKDATNTVNGEGSTQLKIGDDPWGLGEPMRQGQVAKIGDKKVEIDQVDNSANGVKVKDENGQLSWYNEDDLEPIDSDEVVMKEMEQLRRLAGITETASCGATSAGAIASAPAPTALKKEYKRTEAPKTIIGDTKPSQASKELSANLAASKKPTASRPNNGFRK